MDGKADYGAHDDLAYPVVNAIIFWNILCMDATLKQPRAN